MKDGLQEKRILVVDDDIDLCIAIEFVFSQAGAVVYMAYNGQEGLRQFFNNRPDIVILDIHMPEIDGWDVLRQIRLMSDTPVIILTTLNENEAIVQALENGADDFVVKPFDGNVLLARTRAVLRRIQPIAEANKSSIFRDDYLSIDVETRQIFVAGKLVMLTMTEFRLLAYLVQNANRVLTYQQILEHVWGREFNDRIDYIHVYLSRLRSKLEQNPKKPIYLINKQGVGYCFKQPHPD